MKRFIYVIIAFLTLSALLFAGGEKEAEKKAEPAVGEPQYGGKITQILHVRAIPGADLCVLKWPTAMYTSPVLEFLLRGDFEKYGPRGTGEFQFSMERNIPEKYLTGAIAESWNVTADRLTFPIRPGIRWAAIGREDVMESRELTPDDVVFSLKRYIDSAVGGNGSSWTKNGGWIKSIYVEGNAVVVETSKFNANWIWEIAKGWGNAIYAPEVVDAGASDWDNIVGTGPWMVKDVVIGSHFTYERNPIYYGTTTINGKVYDDIPFIDEWVYPIINDESTRIAALRTGAIDIYYPTPLIYKETLDATCPKMLKNPWNHVIMATVSLRCDREPFNNKEVRRAMMIAIDRKAVMTAIGIGGDIYGWPVSSGVTDVYTPIDELPASTQELFVYDPVKAKQMLVDAGYPDGFEVEISTFTQEFSISTGEMIVNYWAEIGVKATVKPRERAALEAYVRAYKHDCITTNQANNFLLSAIEQAFIPAIPTTYGNVACYDNPKLTALYEKASQTVDAGARNAILKELAVMALDEVAYIPIFAQGFEARWWPWVKNYYGEFEDSSWGVGYFLSTMWIDQDLKAEMGY
jgi:peptide/nickel transport system substrate-binding protein